MHTRRHARETRAGFTLTELMIVVVLVGIIGTALTLLLMRQQRFHRSVVSITDSRARMRDIATILPTDLRSVSSAGNDILAFDETSVQFRAFLGTSILCEFKPTVEPLGRVIGIPPRKLASGNVLSAWINPPGPGDIAYVYNDGDDAGNVDDNWDRFTITDSVSSTDGTWCASTLAPAYTTDYDNGARRYRFTLDAAPNTARIKRGAVIRFAREVRYSAYVGSDGQWYVGYQTCVPAGGNTPGVCGARELLAGPIKAASSDTLTSGLFFVFYNQTGARVTSAASAASISRVSVGIRTASESMRQAASTNIAKFTGGDSLRFVIGIRNRI